MAEELQALRERVRQLETERQDLGEKLDLFRQLVERSTVAIGVSAFTERHVYTNPAHAKLFGYTAEELRQMSPADLCTPESARILTSIARPALLEGQGWSAELEVLDRSGRRFPILMVADVLRDAAGEPRYAIGMIYDLSQHRKLEEQRRELDARIQHMQRMESLSVLAGGVAHEFNNLLTGILGNAGLAQYDLPPGSPARENLRDIEIASQRAAELAGQMLAYAGRGPLMTTRIDLARLAGETVTLLESLPGEGVRVVLDTTTVAPPIRGDASQIRQALTNLFSNAVLALGRGKGTITVRTGAASFAVAGPDDSDTPAAVPEGSYAIVEVIDDGCGMEPAELVRAFEPFFSGRFGGRGLGLAAAYGIARSHGGSVELDSRAGEGTRVRMLFPAVDEGPEEQADQGGADETADDFQGRGLVLVVDDDEVVLQVATRILVRHGFSILTARDGYEAVALVESRAADFAAVLLDLVMPRMNGADALIEIRKIRPDVPVVLSTGYSAVEAASRLAGLAVEGFVQKPYRRHQLVAALRRALDRGARS
jgi:PAS domain S-box-containing protein